METQAPLPDENDAQEVAPKKRFWKKFPKPAKDASKTLFWLWIAYQAIKGSLTTAFIWIPLIYAMIKHGH